MNPRIMMWANWRQRYNVSVPSPFDGDPSIPWWYDRISSLAHEWAEWGITDVLFPQPCKTSAGPYPGADGYGLYDDFDIGSKDTPQFGGIPTRFGYADQLRRAVAICHANGMNVLIDHVMHQRAGGRNGIYRYDSATQKGMGRFPKDPGCFRATGSKTIPPWVPEDPVPEPEDDIPFGDQMCPVNAIPKGYVWNGLLEAGDWLFRTLDADGARIDATKGINLEFVKAFMNHGTMANKWFFSEYASGAVEEWWGFGDHGFGLNDWVRWVDGRASTADFAFHYHSAMPMCNDGATFFMGRLADRDNAQIHSNPMNAVPFVESMDSDTNGFATVVFNKELGYALLLAGEGLPQIYYRDWAQEPSCYGLRHPIQNLSWIANVLANGPSVPRLTNNARVYVFERTGGPGLLVTLSNDIWNPDWNTVNVQTSFGAHVRLHDFTGHNLQDVWTDGGGRVTLGVPPAANGKGYSCWSRSEYQGRLIKRNEPRETNQHFEGTDDLDAGPLTHEMATVGRVWAEEGTYLSTRMMTHDGKPPDFACRVAITSPDRTELVCGRSDHVYDHTLKRGWHTIRAMGEGFSDTTRMPFRLSVHYTAPQHLRESEFGI